MATTRISFFSPIRITTLILLLAFSAISYAAGNTTKDSFSKAKKMLEKSVYFDHRETIYCAASFDSKKQITAPNGFHTSKYVKRAKKLEWEHVVPAENFGRTFKEWPEGSPQCSNNKGKSFKDRRCAEKVNVEYRHMQADMFNLYPAIGAVKALRSNYNFTMLPEEASDFGSCKMKIDNRKAEPPVEARGRIARTYLYMDETYSRYSMSKSQKQLMNAWDKMYPVNEWECKRAKKITSLQGGDNNVVKLRCTDKGLW
ncbi:Deoxyribonuclease I [Psychromonas ingrahamii 37]|uniref:Deoxyribonuclease I n=1 Tax=Psychromonas ingrahamii (strain DSM 17664 / CCUG 51855 / 37) TaxID=357804 RepID=A1SXT6_PSYIN|nr:endonuclease [Psychromonas ingrahamii]ABM04301.1 Deoxyribonuclease I [Psychromonas ingrahamii 37]